MVKRRESNFFLEVCCASTGFGVVASNIAVIILCIRVVAVRRLAMLSSSSGAAVSLSGFPWRYQPIDNVTPNRHKLNINRFCKCIEMRARTPAKIELQEQ